MPFLARSSLLSYLVVALTLLIFLLDAFTPLKIAIAVLYGAVILIASPVWSRSSIIKLALICIALTLIAYSIAYKLQFFGPSFGRCLISMAAIAITTFLALRNQAATNRLMEREEALRQANRHKDEFLAMLAHELRNPLAPISAGAHLLKMTPGQTQAVEEVSDIIIRQTDHLNELVNDLLDVSRLTRGVTTIKKERVDIKQVVSDALEQARPLIQNLNHQLEVHVPPEPAIVLGDYKRLVQIVANLLNNAAKYTPEGGNLALRLKHAERQLFLEVSDNGIGIAPELLPHVFDLFTQAQRSPDRTQGGLGIGLALVKALVELHGGSVSARSNRPAAGTTFTVRLTAHEECEAIDSKKLVLQLPPSSAKAMRILLVDDNADAANMLAGFLKAAGHQVNVHYRPADALERAEQDIYDAFILDIGLPDMDGNALAQRLRRIPAAEEACFIAMTGYGAQFNRQTAARAGFDHYLVKPANPTELLTVLESCKQEPAQEKILQRE
ncbi:hybrid sensor histidine kinase/response regulator [Oxalobacteraceae bacterium R-40]|uniref:histidine kinase n=1 Tax=Keguizhuia sedimenti TaxID=3064264 RepID=A0ABU1BV31_9BURK|nr:hybrid sensor histidine kinase/response regulator [Oxalobacteraceae bacterium R-40]